MLLVFPMNFHELQCSGPRSRFCQVERLHLKHQFCQYRRAVAQTVGGYKMMFTFFGDSLFGKGQTKLLCAHAVAMIYATLWAPTTTTSCAWTTTSRTQHTYAGSRPGSLRVTRIRKSKPPSFTVERLKESDVMDTDGVNPNLF